MPARSALVAAICILMIAGTAAAQSSDEAAAPSGLYHVRDFGAAGDGQTKDTEAIQQAIDAANAAGGGTVRFTAGVYLSGTLFLKDHVTLHLAGGATLLGSTEIADYPETVPGRRSYTDNYVYQSLLFGEHVRDVAIVGQGTIDGQGAAFPREHPTRQYGERPYLIRLISSEQIRVAGITLRNSPMWVQHYFACDRVTIDGVTVHSLVNANNDGINIDSCHDVRIANCSIVSGDDAIVLKSTCDRLCRNVAVTNCVLRTRCNGLKLGTESNGGFQNITMTNCALYDVRLAGIALEMVDGGVLDRVLVSGITMENVGTAIFLRLGNRARPFQAGPPLPGMGSFRHVKISHVTATVAEPVGCAIAGLPGHPIEDVSISDVTIRFPGGGKRDLVTREVPEAPEAYPEYKMFGMLPAYGFYCRHVRGISLRDVDVRCKEPDARAAFLFDDVADLAMTGCRGRAYPDAAPTVVLHDVDGAMLRGCVAAPETDVFLRLQGGTDGVFLQGNDLSRAATPFDLATGVPRSSLVESGNRTSR